MDNILNVKIYILLQSITHTISTEVGKINKKLKAEIALIRECTDNLETKFDKYVQYTHGHEEDNLKMKHNVSQLQL